VHSPSLEFPNRLRFTVPDSETPTEDLSFEDALKRLESIVERLEDDAPDLDDALNAYEEGVGIAQTCLDRLDAAEQRVSELSVDDA